ncbi:MAG: phosphatase PAP2 family protein [Candidatus Aminicenantes bacterium]|nr:phosphatase PAP2 family protein [Candidatus Aminicenantes bacterium]
MFQTEIVLFIQSFASDFWTFFFKFWTEIGSSRWTVILVLTILFGISFRAGYILAHAVLWSGLITLYLKELFAVPRPANVDLNVKLLGKSFPNPSHFDSMGAKGFFEWLPRDVVEALRANPVDSWGFPSGHTSTAMTFGSSIFMFFKLTWVRVIALVLIVFIPFSRMYLGRHFLADILGGYFIGFITFLIFYNLAFKSQWFKDFFVGKLELKLLDWKTLLLLFYFLVLPFLLLFVPHVEHEGIGIFLGLNLGFLFLWIRGIPKDSGKIMHRVARVLIALVLYFGVDFLLEKGSHIIITGEAGVVEFIRRVLTIILLIWGSTEISIKLGFFKREVSVP